MLGPYVQSGPMASALKLSPNHHGGAGGGSSSVGDLNSSSSQSAAAVGKQSHSLLLVENHKRILLRCGSQDTPHVPDKPGHS